MGVIIDFAGRRFGRLVVLGRAPDGWTPQGKRIIRWRCRCDCGGEKAVRAGNLADGGIRSCGCLRREICGATGRANTGTIKPRHRKSAGRAVRDRYEREEREAVIDQVLGIGKGPEVAREAKPLLCNVEAVDALSRAIGLR